MQILELDASTIRQRVADWARQRPGMGMLVLLPEAGTPLVAGLQAACREFGVPVCGGIFPAIIRDERFVTDAGWMLALPPDSLAVLVAPSPQDPAPAIDQLVEQLRVPLAALPRSAHKPVLMLLCDGLLPNIASLLDLLYLQLANRVMYVGANAGNERFETAPCLFDGEHLIAGGVLAVLRHSTQVPALRHGYQTPKKPMSATSTAGNRIASIDWRPAFAVYGELIAQEYEVTLTADNFYQYGVHFPLGMLQANGDIVLRIPVGLTEDGALLCVGEVPENALLVVVRATESDACDGITQLADDLGNAPGGTLGRDLLVFYCAGRRMHLGEGAPAELSALAAQTEVSCLGGALSIGEIGSLRPGAYPMFHNASVAGMVWSPS